MGARGVVDRETVGYLERALTSVRVLHWYQPPLGPVVGRSTPQFSEPGTGVNLRQIAKQVAPRAPALSFSISYPSPGGRKLHTISIQAKLTIKHYLASQPGLKNVWIKYRSIDKATKKKVYMRSVPYQGQEILLT